jgi:LacI family transcriptional regulator
MSNAPSHKRSTIYDVAKAAGVSYQTVSRVINNNPNVALKTRNRVIKAIDELGYRPNKAAQVLNTQRSHLIEVIALDIFSGGPVIDTISQLAKRYNYKVIVSAIKPDDLETTLDDALGRTVDGFLFIITSTDITSAELARLCQDVPFVRMIDAQESTAPSVIYDQRYGAQVATQHLIDLGHRRIAHLVGPYGNADAIARRDGWLETLNKNHLERGPMAGGNFTVQAGYEAMHTIFADGEPFTAVFAANDEMALGAMHALHERGLRVPDDISIVGFDDTNFSPYVDPPLTTLRQDWQAMARLSTEYLIERIEKPDTPIYQRILMPEFIVRASTRKL